MEPPTIIYHVGYAWQDGLRFGFGHRIIRSMQPILTDQQLDEVAQALRESAELPETATVSILGLSPQGQIQPKPSVLRAERMFRAQ